MLEKLKKISLFLILTSVATSICIFAYDFVDKIPSKLAALVIYDILYYNVIPTLMLLIGFTIYIIVFVIDCIQYCKKKHAR